MKHAPSPWTINIENHGIFVMSRSYCVARVGDIDTANAKRIVACVNALDGVEDPEKFIEELPFKIIELGTLKMKATFACERLTTALKGMTSAFISSCTTNEQVEAMKEANQLLIELSELPAKKVHDKWEDQEGDVHV